MLRDSPTFDEFAAFIREYWSVSDRKAIALETRFERDLGLAGDDGNDLLEATEKRFGVTLCFDDTGVRETFNLGPNEYLFHSEGIGFDGVSPSLLFSRGAAITVREFTVGDLFSAVRRARKS
jgi:hypothetical protein